MLLIKYLGFSVIKSIKTILTHNNLAVCRGKVINLAPLSIPFLSLVSMYRYK